MAAYLVAEKLADEHLKLAHSVIIDAVSPVNESREMWQRLAETNNARLAIIKCVLDPEIHRRRIEARVRNLPGIPEVTWSDVEQRLREYLAWEADRPILDTADGQETNLCQALEFVGAA